MKYERLQQMFCIIIIPTIHTRHPKPSKCVVLFSIVFIYYIEWENIIFQFLSSRDSICACAVYYRITSCQTFPVRAIWVPMALSLLLLTQMARTTGAFSTTYVIEVKKSDRRLQNVFCFGSFSGNGKPPIDKLMNVIDVGFSGIKI